MVHFWPRPTRVGMSPDTMQQPRMGRASSRQVSTTAGAPGGGGGGAKTGGGGGLCLLSRLGQYKRRQREQHKRRVAEKELDTLHHRIDKLLAKMEDGKDAEISLDQEEECVVCLGARATMQTLPCQHRVICRKCFIRTIQVAVSQRSLPLKCVVCRTRITKLRHVTSGFVGKSSVPCSPDLQCTSDISTHTGGAFAVAMVDSNNNSKSCSNKRHGISSVARIAPVSAVTSKRDDTSSLTFVHPAPRVTLTSRPSAMVPRPATYQSTNRTSGESTVAMVSAKPTPIAATVTKMATSCSSKKGDVISDVSKGNNCASRASRVKPFVFRPILWFQ